MKRSVLFEALVVGLINLLVFSTLMNLKMPLYVKLILTGALIHLLFEYSPFGNLNKMWCRSTFPATKA
jgi:hypothetical protein